MRTITFALLAALLASCGGRPAPDPSDTGKAAATEEGEPKPGDSLIVLTPNAVAKLHEFRNEGQAKGDLPRQKLYLRLRIVEGAYKLDLDPDTAPETTSASPAACRPPWTS